MWRCKDSGEPVQWTMAKQLMRFCLTRQASLSDLGTRMATSLLLDVNPQEYHYEHTGGSWKTGKLLDLE